jgi:hypothetical protein
LNNDYGATNGTNGRIITLSAPPPLYNPNSPGSLCGVLPVALTDFKVRQMGSDHLILWSVDAKEVKSFVIEYSLNGIVFHTLAVIAGGRVGDFQYLHRITGEATIYYRLK